MGRKAPQNNENMDVWIGLNMNFSCFTVQCGVYIFYMLVFFFYRSFLYHIRFYLAPTFCPVRISFNRSSIEKKKKDNNKNNNTTTTNGAHEQMNDDASTEIINQARQNSANGYAFIILTYRKNSILSLYHLTECRASPFILYSHDNSALSRKSTIFGTAICVKCIPFIWWQPIEIYILKKWLHIAYD